MEMDEELQLLRSSVHNLWWTWELFDMRSRNRFDAWLPPLLLPYWTKIQPPALVIRPAKAIDHSTMIITFNEFVFLTIFFGMQISSWREKDDGE